MITYRFGDAVKAFDTGEVDILVHGCNCYHTMGAGIAKQIAKRFPEALTEDKKTIYGPAKLGRISIAEVERVCGIKGFVINAYTQDTYCDSSRMLNYSSVYNSMLFTKHFAESKNLSIGMPKIGAGLARGDWVKISDILDRIFGDKEIFVYEFRP